MCYVTVIIKHKTESLFVFAGNGKRENECGTKIHAHTNSGHKLPEYIALDCKRVAIKREREREFV